METVVAIIRIIVGLAFVAYGVICICAGFSTKSGCLLHAINVVVGPLLTVIMVLIFPQIKEEVMAMDDSGALILAIGILFFVAPIGVSLLVHEGIAGLLNGFGFIFVGMILSGVIPSVIILGVVGILVKIISVVAIPAVIIIFFFA